MKLLQQLIDYCRDRRLLSPDQINELAEINASCFGMHDYYDDSYERCDDCGRYYSSCVCDYLDEQEKLIEGLSGPVKKKQGRSGKKREWQERLKLSALSESLRAGFEKRFSDSPETFDVLTMLYRLADLSPIDDGLPDWPRFQTIVKSLYGLKEEKIVPKIEKSLLSIRKASLSLGSIYALIVDSTEIDFLEPQFFGPAVTAYQALLQLGDQSPPPKLLWPLKDEVVSTIFQYRCLKQRLIRFLRNNWKLRSEKITSEGRGEFRVGHQNRTWESIPNRTQKEVEIILRSGKHLAEPISMERLFSPDDLEVEFPVHLFEKSSWELALLIDPRSVMPLIGDKLSSK